MDQALFVTTVHVAVFTLAIGFVCTVLHFVGKEEDD